MGAFKHDEKQDEGGGTGGAYLRFTNYELRITIWMLARYARGGKASDGPVQGAREAGGQDDWTKAQLLPAGR